MSTKTIPGTPSWLRATNDRTALALLLKHGTLTRNRLGELSGLSKPTASQMVSRLESAGLIHVVGEVSAGRGPNAANYAVRVERALGVAIDVNVGQVRSTVVDANGTTYPIVETPLARAARDRSAVSDVRGAIDAACAAAGVDRDSVRTVCIAVQGAVDPRTDELTFAETLPGWPRKGVHALLEDDLGISVIIDNDVNLAGIAERAHGAGQGTGGFALLWMGEGLGLGVDLGGVLHRGVAGGAGEIGYLPAPRDAALYDPAARDLQDLIGGVALTRMAREYGIRGRNYKAVIGALASNSAREPILGQLAPRIASGVIPVLALLDPEVVVLGGPTGRLGGSRLAELVRAQVKRTSRWNPRIVASAVEDSPVLLGARETLITEVRELLFSRVSAIEL